MNSGGLLRVKTGCLTCRQVLPIPSLCSDSNQCRVRVRRVKCDEAKPVCQKCSSTGRKCDGYKPGPVSRKKQPPSSRSQTPPDSDNPAASFRAIQPASNLLTFRPRSLHVLPYDSDDDKTSFDCFTLCSTANGLLPVKESRFWYDLVLPAASSEAAIKHLVLALGGFNRHWHGLSGAAMTSYDELAIEVKYWKAVQHTSRLLARADRDDVYMALIACVLFVYLDLQRGNWMRVKMHVRRGLSICMERMKSASSQAPSKNDPFGLIHDALARAELQIIVFSDFSWYHSDLKLDDLLPPLNRDEAFDTFDEAHRSIIDIQRALYGISERLFPGALRTDSRIGAFEAMGSLKACCNESLELWNTKFTAYRDTIPGSKRTPAFKKGCALLTLYYKQARMHCLAGHNFHGKRFDDFVPVFREMVALIEDIYFEALPDAETPKIRDVAVTFELGFISHLWSISQLCRDPWVRRRAIKLLYAANRCEGIWHSIAAARVGQRTLEYEETRASEMNGKGYVVCAADVPEESRVNGTKVDGTLPERKVTCQVLVGLTAPEGPSWHDLGEVYF